MSGVLDRVTRLLALATSENENEARNAAVQACKLIRQHDLRLSLPPHPMVNRPIPSAYPSTYEPVTPRRAVIVDDYAPMVIKAKMSSPCLDCGDFIQQGDNAWYVRGRGMVHHLKCDPDILTKIKV